MDSRVAALSKVGPSLADLLMDVFCFAASPSFKGAAGIVGGARRVFKGVRQVSGVAVIWAASSRGGWLRGSLPRTGTAGSGVWILRIWRSRRQRFKS